MVKYLIVFFFFQKQFPKAALKLGAGFLYTFSKLVETSLYFLQYQSVNGPSLNKDERFLITHKVYFAKVTRFLLTNFSDYV